MAIRVFPIKLSELNESMNSVNPWETDEEYDNFDIDYEHNDHNYVPDRNGTENYRLDDHCDVKEIVEEEEIFVPIVTDEENCIIEEKETLYIESIVGAEEIVPAHAVSSAAASKSVKRRRSPLSSFKMADPNIVLADGFIVACDELVSKDVSKITWRERSMRLNLNEMEMQDDSPEPAEIRRLQTPMDFFCYFFTKKKIVEIITEETNRKALAENTNINVVVNEIYHFIGILVYMSDYRFPDLKSHWGQHYFAPIQRTMIFERFIGIKKYLSFRDEGIRIENESPGYDPLFRIRNLADEINKRFDSVSMLAKLCVEKKMCNTKFVRILDPMTRVFYHFINKAATNAYILYRCIYANKYNHYNNEQAGNEKMLQSLEFREKIADDLILVGQLTSTAAHQITLQQTMAQETTLQQITEIRQPSLTIGQRAKHPIDNLRFDKFNHFPLNG